MAEPPKPKLTKAEKEFALLHKDAQKMRESGAKFQEFMRIMNPWLKQKGKDAAKICQFYDESNSGKVDYPHFKACMTQLDAPCFGTEIEFHLLVDLFDKDGNHEVPYLQLEAGLSFVKTEEDLAAENFVYHLIRPTDRDLKGCPACKMVTWDGENFKSKTPRYVLLLIRFITFEKTFQGHPGHFQLVVPIQITIYTIINIIKEHTGLTSTTLAIYTDKTRDVESLLPVHMSLEDCGFKGGSAANPDELLLYYDFIPEFTKCSLLVCDYYFTQPRELTQPLKKHHGAKYDKSEEDVPSEIPA